ncbi:MAG: rhomboid family intramembrane serine protease [Anaerotignum sp.]|nr:rhomboid family intramembrane serine protease [Anaerotignum sp.]MCI8866782.1 rhomboid family intramembrane serine protease [Anaerotignum sp.]
MAEKKIKISFNSPVILGFTLFSLVALLLAQVTGGGTNDLFFSVYRAPLTDPLTWVRFFGHVLGHAGWQHFIGNIMLILVIGPLLEEKYGSGEVLFVILITAFVTGLLNFALFPQVQLLGASGVAFALILLSSFVSVKEGEIPLTFLLVAVIYIGGEVINGIFIRDSVSNLSHIAGGAVGAVLGVGLCGRKLK